jgi:hypothetical protein
VWYDYARWQLDMGRTNEASTCLQRAVHVLPNCLLLFFALADLHEAQGDAAAAKEVCVCVCVSCGVPSDAAVVVVVVRCQVCA